MTSDHSLARPDVGPTPAEVTDPLPEPDAEQPVAKKMQQKRKLAPVGPQKGQPCPAALHPWSTPTPRRIPQRQRLGRAAGPPAGSMPARVPGPHCPKWPKATDACCPQQSFTGPEVGDNSREDRGVPGTRRVNHGPHQAAGLEAAPLQASGPQPTAQEGGASTFFPQDAWQRAEPHVRSDVYLRSKGTGLGNDSFLGIWSPRPAGRPSGRAQRTHQEAPRPPDSTRSLSGRDTPQPSREAALPPPESGVGGQLTREARRNRGRTDPQRRPRRDGEPVPLQREGPPELLLSLPGQQVAPQPTSFCAHDC